MAFNDGTEFATQKVKGNRSKRFAFKEAFRQDIYVQQHLLVQVLNDLWGDGPEEAPYSRITLEAIKKMKPGLLKKFDLERRVEFREPGSLGPASKPR